VADCDNGECVTITLQTEKLDGTSRGVDVNPFLFLVHPFHGSRYYPTNVSPIPFPYTSLLLPLNLARWSVGLVCFALLFVFLTGCLFVCWFLFTCVSIHSFIHSFICKSSCACQLGNNKRKWWWWWWWWWWWPWFFCTCMGDGHWSPGIKSRSCVRSKGQCKLCKLMLHDYLRRHMHRRRLT